MHAGARQSTMLTSAQSINQWTNGFPMRARPDNRAAHRRAPQHHFARDGLFTRRTRSEQPLSESPGAPARGPWSCRRGRRLQLSCALPRTPDCGSFCHLPNAHSGGVREGMRRGPLGPALRLHLEHCCGGSRWLMPAPPPEDVVTDRQRTTWHLDMRWHSVSTTLVENPDHRSQLLHRIRMR